MTLIDAINSGRPFRRKAWSVAAGCAVKTHQCRYIEGGLSLELVLDDGQQTREVDWDDILADDWEIQEPKVEITRAQFLEAFGQMYCEPPFCGRAVDSSFAIALAVKLGLGGGP